MLDPPVKRRVFLFLDLGVKIEPGYLVTPDSKQISHVMKCVTNAAEDVEVFRRHPTFQDVPKELQSGSFVLPAAALLMV